MSADTGHVSHLFAAYFHQDSLLDDPDWESIVRRYRSSEPFDVVRRTQSEMTALLERSTEAELERFLFGPELLWDYDPRPEGLTLRAWLEEIVHLLAGGSAPAPRTSATSEARRKAVAIARHVLTEGDDPILASRELNALRRLLDVPKDDPDFDCFIAIDSETDALPVGPQRALWAPESLAALELEVSQAREWAMTHGRRAFESVLRRFGGAG